MRSTAKWILHDGRSRAKAETVHDKLGAEIFTESAETAIMEKELKKCFSGTIRFFF